jgi:hypothetical protein
MKQQIKINKQGLQLMAGTILEPEAPTVDSIKEAIFGLCLAEDAEAYTDVIVSLVGVYRSLLDYDDVEYALSDDADDWAAEKVYRKFIVQGWRDVVKRSYPEAVKSRTDDDVYEGCPWYEFNGIFPTQLLAEMAYAMGVKAGREAVQMARFHEQHRAKESANV